MLTKLKLILFHSNGKCVVEISIHKKMESQIHENDNRRNRKRVNGILYYNFTANHKRPYVEATSCPDFDPPMLVIAVPKTNVLVGVASNSDSIL